MNSHVSESGNFLWRNQYKLVGAPASKSATNTATSCGSMLLYHLDRLFHANHLGESRQSRDKRPHQPPLNFLLNSLAYF
jgi:hypothetical protein